MAVLLPQPTLNQILNSLDGCYGAKKEAVENVQFFMDLKKKIAGGSLSNLQASFSKSSAKIINTSCILNLFKYALKPFSISEDISMNEFSKAMYLSQNTEWVNKDRSGLIERDRNNVKSSLGEMAKSFDQLNKINEYAIKIQKIANFSTAATAFSLVGAGLSVISGANKPAIGLLFFSVISSLVGGFYLNKTFFEAESSLKGVDGTLISVGEFMDGVHNRIKDSHKYEQTEIKES